MIKNLASLRAQLSSQTPEHSLFDDGDPRKLEHLSLEQQKKRAKELLQDWRSTTLRTGKTPKLHDAQLNIAQGYGFRNWAELKTHIEQSEVAHNALASGEPNALDGDHKALHIRCGNDIRHPMAVAGFNGDFLVFPDPYVHGPVPQTATFEEYIQIRANYLSSDNNPPYEEVIENLTQSYQYLEKARNYDAVYLWFEHDSYDQLTVAKLLDFFSAPDKRPPIVKIINITQFPGVKIFNGIGQLPPVAMRVLWDKFKDITPEQYTIGQQAWTALQSSTPQALRDLIATGTPELPTMAIALDRHLKQLPCKQNGLNLTENLTLQILKEKGSMNAARLFGWYTNHYEPLTFMGDTIYWQVLKGLASAKHPAIVLDQQGDKPKQWQIKINDIGYKLLMGKADWLELNNIDYWVGGIHIDTLDNLIVRN